MAAGFAACDGGGTPPLQVASGGSSNGSGGSGTTPQGGSVAAAGSGGAATMLPGIPLEPMAGWVPNTNEAKIQGALFSFGDATSKMGLVEDFTGSKACIKGNAAKVDTSSDICKNKTFTPPAMDCYGEYWGVAIGLNLNQSIDPATMMGAKEVPYDATNLEGFGFDIEGATIPGGTDFRFKVEDGTKEYCTPKAVKVKKGFQIIKFSDLMAECWQTTDPPNATVTPTVQSHLIKISWQVVTNTGGVVPFDFCVSDIRAIPKAGTSGAPPGSSSGGSTGAGGSAAGGASAGGAGGTAAGGTSAGGTAAGGTSAGGTSAGGTSAGGSSAGSGGAKAGSGGTAG
jgi:hypothetical protein